MKKYIRTRILGILDADETIMNIKGDPENLTMEQIFKIRELELLERIADELKYMNELKERE